MSDALRRAAINWQKEFLKWNDKKDPQVQKEGMVGRNAFIQGAIWQRDEDAKRAKKAESEHESNGANDG